MGDRPINQGTSIYVGNLPQKWTKTDLARVFNVFGEVLHIQLMEWHSPMYGFVVFEDAKAADAAVTAMHGRKVGDDVLKVRISQTIDAANLDPSQADFSRSSNRVPKGQSASSLVPRERNGAKKRRKRKRKAKDGGGGVRQGTTGAAEICANCKRAGHQLKDCPREYACTMCHKTGHIAQFCRCEGKDEQ